MTTNDVGNVHLPEQAPGIHIRYSVVSPIHLFPVCPINVLLHTRCRRLRPISHGASHLPHPAHGAQLIGTKQDKTKVLLIYLNFSLLIYYIFVLFVFNTIACL